MGHSWTRTDTFIRAKRWVRELQNQVKLSVGGFRMEAATSLYSLWHLLCIRKIWEWNPYPSNLSAIVGLSGWLPCAKSLNEKLTNDEAATHASSLSILLCHGIGGV